MDAIMSFKQAAKDFQQDELYLRYQTARKENDADQQLQDDIGAFNLARLDLNNEMEKEDRDDGRIASLNDRVSELYGTIMKNPHMVAYNQAKEDVEGFMNAINAIMNAAIQGEDPMLVDPAAAACDPDDCASCASSGCC